MLRSFLPLPSVVLFISFIVIGCAHTAKPLDTGIDASLKRGEGFILLALETNRSLSSLVLRGRNPLYFKETDLRRGTNFLLVSVPAGKYSLERISLGWDHFMPKRNGGEIWDIDVREGIINYVGHLDFHSWDWAARIELVNKSSVALEFLEENFSAILASHGVTYSGPGEDDFFEVVRGAKAVDVQP